MGGGNLTAVFCDTGWEHPDTYKHVNDVCLQMGVRLITLKSKYDFVSLAAHKKRFPSTNARFCTSELKMKPMIDYVLSLKESCIIIQGIRAGESTARAAMEEECMYFKKTERLIKRRAAEFKKLYETPNPEVDKIISELRAEATKRPQNMSKEEEIAYILKKADENCDHIEIRKILNVSNT